MKQQEIYDKWTQFITKYKKYMMSNEEQWDIMLGKVSKYIDENNKRPSGTDKNTDIKQLAKWIGHQQTNYAKRTEIMQQQEIYDKWTKFIIKYKNI